MVHQQDSDLSESARAYIQSLQQPHAREAAREYARMDPHNFQARIGPGLDKLEEGQAEILAEIRSSKRQMSKKVVAILMLVAGGATEGVIRALDRLK